MKINWLISRDNKTALLNNGDLEVQIKEIDLKKSNLLNKKFQTNFKQCVDL